MRRLRSNEPCWCGSGTKLKRCHGDHQRWRRPPVEPGAVGPMRTVPAAIVRPPYVADGTGWPARRASVQVLAGSDVDRLRHASQVAAEVLAAVGRHVAAGVTTEKLDAVAHDEYVARGAYPSTLGYKGFTKSICTSVNEVVCHGIPDSRPLRSGDVVNVDVTAYVEGMHGDTSATFCVGAVDEPTAALVDLSRRALLAGVAAVHPGGDRSDIGRAITPLALSHGLGVVRDYGGHGIGRVFHAPPHIHHGDDRVEPCPLRPGMAFTIEPMLNAGVETHHEWPDGWTVVTDDLLPSAQFEHTVLVTDVGAEVLTLTASGTSPAGVPGAATAQPTARRP